MSEEIILYKKPQDNHIYEFCADRWQVRLDVEKIKIFATLLQFHRSPPFESQLATSPIKDIQFF
ncbi:hypothetical protein ACCY16_08450 [Candidatus Pantoea formicae]|uniref:hypothetical protein n=1 Tax=Candidatus Pantoea formicae TaxID=2608355 RepID=UPI003ED989CE